MVSSKSSSKGKTSVILPCYNEKENILELINVLSQTLKDSEFEIIVVDDNSPDKTIDAVEKLANPNVKTVLRTQDPSLGGSILDGILIADGEYLVLMDSDFNHAPSYIPFMVSNLKFYDCVSASRFQYGGKMDSRSRTLLSWIYNIAIRMVTGGMVTDSLYGYCAIKRDLLFNLGLCNSEIFRGYGDYFIRLMFHLQRNHITILQFPAVNGKRRHGEGNSSFFPVFRQYTREVIKLVIKERLFQK